MRGIELGILVNLGAEPGGFGEEEGIEIGAEPMGIGDGVAWTGGDEEFVLVAGGRDPGLAG